MATGRAKSDVEGVGDTVTDGESGADVEADGDIEGVPDGVGDAEAE